MVDTLQTGFQKFNGLQSPNEIRNGHGNFPPPANLASLAPTQYMTQNTMPPALRKSKKRRLTTSVMPYPTPTAESSSAGILERTQSYDTAMPTQVNHQSQQQAHTSQTQPDFLPTTTGPMRPALDQSQTFTQNVFSPTFNFSPLPAGIAMPNDFGAFDTLYSGQGLSLIHI